MGVIFNHLPLAGQNDRRGGGALSRNLPLPPTAEAIVKFHLTPQRLRRKGLVGRNHELFYEFRQMFKGDLQLN